MTDGMTDIRAGWKAFVTTVVAVYAVAFLFPQPLSSPLEIIGALVAGGLYLLVGLGGVDLYASSGSPWILAALYAIEVPLAGLIVYGLAGFFLAGLVALPLVSLSVHLLPRRRMLVVCAACIASLALAYGLRGGWTAALSAAIGYLTAILFVVLVTRMAVREREARAEVERLAAELERTNQQLRRYAAQAEELAVAHERARLANELHDSVGHTLTALDVQMELLVRLPPDRTERRRQVAEQARSLVKTGLADLRRAVQALRPAALETFSLPEAIAALLADSDLPITWQVEGEASPLPPRLALPLYRATQEALTNIQRHAPAARQVTVRLRYEPEAVTLSVENDGLPSPARAGSQSGVQARTVVRAEQGEGGHGLRGLRERAEALGGRFQAGPVGAGRFRLEMRLPITSPT